jgi:hypothetical protein
MRPFTFPHARKFWSLAPGQVSLQGPGFYGMDECKMSHSRDRKTFPAFGVQKVFFQGPEEFSDMRECKTDLWVAGKMSWYQQRDCQSLVKEFSEGKLKQKGFFHSV